MMKILINACLHIGGGLQVADSFIRELINYTENEYIVIISNEVKELLEPLDKFPQNFKFINITYSKPSFARIISARYKTFDDIVEKYKPDVAFTIFGPAYWKPKNISHICGFAIPHYIYKNSPFFDIISVKQKLIIKIKKFFGFFSWRNNGKIIISENKDVSNSLKKHFPNHKIYTVTNYYNQVFDDESLQQEIFLPKIDGITLLTIASNYPHKNLKIIKPVAEYLTNKYPDFKFRFVVTINAEDFGYNKNNIPNWFLPIGKVKISQCTALYKQSDFMFLPTLLECFSASYPEAMKMQKPILTSDLSFAHGLCENAAEYFNPISAQDIAEKIYNLANDIERQKYLIEQGNKQLLNFDDNKTRARKYLDIIKSEIYNK